MARGQRSENNPNRQVHRGRFEVGDVVHMPSVGAVTVETKGKRYFTGQTSTGSPVRPTGNALVAGMTMRGGHPWKVDRRG